MTLMVSTVLHQRCKLYLTVQKNKMRRLDCHTSVFKLDWCSNTFVVTGCKSGPRGALLRCEPDGRSQPWGGRMSELLQCCSQAASFLNRWLCAFSLVLQTLHSHFLPAFPACFLLLYIFSSFLHLICSEEFLTDLYNNLFISSFYFWGWRANFTFIIRIVEAGVLLSALQPS